MHSSSIHTQYIALPTYVHMYVHTHAHTYTHRIVTVMAELQMVKYLSVYTVCRHYQLTITVTNNVIH